MKDNLNLYHFLVILIFTTIVLSLIWARLCFFKTSPQSNRFALILYDPFVATQTAVAYERMFFDDPLPAAKAWLAISAYSFSLWFFCWSIRSAKGLGFAFSEASGTLLWVGSYSIVRHPFYTAYILTWTTTTLLFDSTYLWITLAYLMFFYTLSAKQEEEHIKRSKLSKDYEAYKCKTGMFFPRVTQWINWLSKLLPTRFQ